MGKRRYKVESDFDDLHGNPADAIDLDVDLNDTDNPIIQAALNGDEDDYQPPKDEDKDDEKNDEKFLDDDEDDDLDELADDDDDGDDSGDEDEDEDDEDDDSDEDEEDDDEDDDEKYSKKVQKRIDRERDARRADNDKSNRRIAILERKISLGDARSKFREEKADAEVKLIALRKKKKEALDEEDTSAVVDIDEEILDIKADQKAKEIELKRQETDLENDVDEGGTGDNTPAAGRKWLEKYPQFHSNQRFRNTVLGADQMVSARGFDKNTDEYYEEMEKILAPQFPKIIKIAKKTTKKQQTRQTARKRKRSAVGSTTKAGTRKGNSKRGVIRLTKQDQEQMEIFGMDPKNPQDIKAWADSKGS